MSSTWQHAYIFNIMNTLIKWYKSSIKLCPYHYKPVQHKFDPWSILTDRHHTDITQTSHGVYF